MYICIKKFNTHHATFSHDRAMKGKFCYFPGTKTDDNTTNYYDLNRSAMAVLLISAVWTQDPIVTNGTEFGINMVRFGLYACI